jgi:hypothetical protein
MAAEAVWAPGAASGILSSMKAAEKVREARVRRMLARQGYTLSRSRRRDPRAVDYGVYAISRDGTVIYEASGLDDAERWTLAEDGQR